MNLSDGRRILPSCAIRRWPDQIAAERPQEIGAYFSTGTGETEQDDNRTAVERWPLWHGSA